MQHDFHLSRKVNARFDETIGAVTEALKKQGFGIITTIDIRATFKEKLGKEFRNYTILGACNPSYAYEAIREEDKMGVYLPCNVIVQEHPDGSVEVSAINPEEMIPSGNHPSLTAFAIEVKQALEKALEEL